ncbi:urate oxidase [Paenibacillus sp. FSL H8-0548]|uniref:factor-independent urate hydroxylase n=1 Tax=Paenibacillus sp. FSL H8-0548 TaxID=1920422 RepID=UPI00096D139B|nr:urate oxidase [Paenibacillus sp. FSL H8-0548]OMF24856.1 urate oxidase [Paenibacillus sp. FSL H8-0548]
MLKLRNGRTLYYGKGDVLSYRTYAAPLLVNEIPESRFLGDSNVIFAHNITFSVSSEVLLTSFTEGDNTMVVATDSMKNFILRQTANYNGSTTEGLLAFISEQFLTRYPHIDAIEISASRLPFHSVPISEDGIWNDSQLVFRRSHNEHASASLKWIRGAEGEAVLAQHESSLSNIQLIKVSGSSFYGFVRDEYTTLPESYDRPLFIFLTIYWTYEKAEDAFDSGRGRYVPSEQVHDLAHTLFHSSQSPSIQYLIYRIGKNILTSFPQLAEVRFESNNRTWETVVEPASSAAAGVYTEPRPPYGFQGFTLTRADLDEGEEL